MSFWKTIFPLTAMGTAIVGVVGFVVNETIKRLFSRDLERFKSDMARSAFEHQVRYSRLHEKQAEVVAKIYTHITTVEDAFHPLVSVAEGRIRTSGSDEYKAFYGVFREFKLCFRQDRIYLAQSLCNEIDTCLALADKGAETWCEAESPYEIDQQLRALSEALATIRKDLEKEFRTLLRGSDAA